MSKTVRSIFAVFAASLLILRANGTSAAQDIEATLRVDAEQASVEVDGKFTGDGPAVSQPLTFLSDYAGISLAPGRISKIQRSGRTWSYQVDIAPLKAPAAAAHLSWLTSDRGILRLDDLLPLPKLGERPRGKVTLDLKHKQRRPMWTVGTIEKPGEDGSYLIEDIERAVFYLGFEPSYPLDDSGHAAAIVLSASGLDIDMAESLTLAGEVYQGYRNLFRAERRPVLLALTQFPFNAPMGQWEAATRGQTITIISSNPVFKSQISQRLHEQLRHEMFHVWIPEGVNLTGNYDWFYEGFALYQSLKLGVAVNRIRFEDYLDSLMQAFAIDRRIGGKTSLIDASMARWSGDNNSVVYARGMLVAFLCDLVMLEASKGKRSADDIVREVYQKHGDTATPQDGNAAIMAIMKQRPELVPMIERYVTGAEKLDWAAFLNATGLEATGGILKAVAKPTGRQKKLLDKLGYNNWRKLSSTRK